MVDTLSKFAFAEPVKHKTGQEVASAFKAILERVKPRRPERLQTDKGKEFYNAQFKKVLGNIEHLAQSLTKRRPEWKDGIVHSKV